MWAFVGLHTVMLLQAGPLMVWMDGNNTTSAQLRRVSGADLSNDTTMVTCVLSLPSG
jgi:hypothetical protein